MAFNGTCFLGNPPTFTAKAGQRVRWHVATLGKEFHVFHLHGHRLWVNLGLTDALLTLDRIGNGAPEFSAQRPGLCEGE